MINLSTSMAGSLYENRRLKTYNISKDTLVDIDITTNIVIIKSDDEHELTISNPIRETQDVLIKNDSQHDVLLVLNGRSVTLTIDEIVRIVSTKVDEDIIWYVVGANEASFDIISPPMEYKIIASNIEEYDQFGFSVAISGDGMRCIIGAYNDDDGGSNAGAVYIFHWNGSTWIEEQKMWATDSGNADYFGYSVDISDDGSRCIVGAYGKNTRAGAAYIFSRSDTTWTEEQKMPVVTIAEDQFGYSVDISGDGLRCVVGANGSGTTWIGDAYIFVRFGTTWAEEQHLTAGDGDLDDRFGASVSMNIDGTRCIVGANRDDKVVSYGGAAYVFVRSDTTWAQEQKLITGDIQTGDMVGGAVSISDDGTRCIVGAYGEDEEDYNSGAAYIFLRSDTTWIEEQKITSNELGSSVLFGQHANMSGDGSKVIVGAYGDSTIAPSAGAFYVFGRTGTTWSLDHKMMASVPDVFDRFGHSVSISDDGSRCVTGAYNEDTFGLSAGAAYIYDNI